MKFGEAMVSMENGKKVRIKSWPEHMYVALGTTKGEIVDQNGKVLGLGSCFTYEWELYNETVPISTLKEGEYFEFSNQKYRIIPRWMLEHVEYKPDGFTIPAIRCYKHSELLTCFTPYCIVVKI